MLLPNGLVSLRLDRPPVVVNAGAAVHGTTGPHDRFLLPDLWQLHLYSYSGELTLGGVTHPIRPGHVSLVPAGCPVDFRYLGRSEHLFVHLRPAASGVAQTIPVMQDAGAQADLLAVLLRQSISAAPHLPVQAAAEVWTALWRVARLSNPGADPRHLAVVQAMEYLESHLAEPISIPRVAEHADISHNQLTRLFRAETGDTVVAYLRRRRLARAEHLLRHSTLPIAAIAAAVGIPDLQAFNKACRRELGRSPRAIRR